MANITPASVQELSIGSVGMRWMVANFTSVNGGDQWVTSFPSIFDAVAQMSAQPGSQTVCGVSLSISNKTITFNHADTPHSMMCIAMVPK